MFSTYRRFLYQPTMNDTVPATTAEFSGLKSIVEPVQVHVEGLAQVREQLIVVVRPLLEEQEKLGLEQEPGVRHRVLRVHVGRLEHLDDLVVDNLPDVQVHLLLSHEEDVLLQQMPSRRLKTRALLNRNLTGWSQRSPGEWQG